MDLKQIIVLVILIAVIGLSVYRVVEGQIKKNKEKKKS
jgi:hypothetical protein